MRQATAIAALLLALPWALSSANAREPTTWVGTLKTEGTPGAGLLSEKFDDAVRDQLGRSKKVKLFGSRTAQKIEAGATDPRVVEAETLRTAGKVSFAAGEFDRARGQLLSTLEFYEEALASVDNLAPVVETLGYLGAASLQLGYDGDAKDYFRRAAAVAPEAEPLEDYSDEARELFNKTREKLGKRRKGRIKVVTVPAGATVRVDGVDRGPSPVTVGDLWRGTHYVQASLDGAGVSAARAKVKGRKVRTVELKLSTEIGPKPASDVDPAVAAELVALAGAGELGKPYQEKAREVGRHTKSDCVVVGNISAAGNSFKLHAHVYDMKAEAVHSLAPFDFRPNLASAVAQAALFSEAVEETCTDFPANAAVVPVVAAAPPPDEPPPDEPPLPPDEPPPPDAGAPPPPPSPPPPSPDEEDDDAWYAQWWVWTVVGAAVIGGTAYGGYLLLQDDTQDRTVDATVHW